MTQVTQKMLLTRLVRRPGQRNRTGVERPKEQWLQSQALPLVNRNMQGAHRSPRNRQLWPTVDQDRTRQ